MPYSRTAHISERKDFQQLAIIREMVRQLKYNLEIVGCSIVREEDGLALSSRNKRLSAEERENALNISRTLFKSRNFAATHTVSETQKMVEDAIEAAPGLRMEYFEIVDGNTLQKISNWEDASVCSWMYHSILWRSPAD